MSERADQLADAFYEKWKRMNREAGIVVTAPEGVSKVAPSLNAMWEALEETTGLKVADMLEMCCGGKVE